ncbi:MAG: SRPBCC family protein [Niastella sp.]|uniref:SRPBCC family protein n=1 Tax=Niastella sp. TaxID=1869183 RepID=UPI00389A87BE
MTNDFNSSISAKISASEAIKKISNVTGWWGVTLTGNTEKQHDTFQITMGGDSFFAMTVTELVPAKRVVWLITDCNMPWFNDKKEWANTRLIFDLNENNGETDLTFIHEGLTPDVECYKDCEQGWTHWIKTSLHSYLTTGQGVFRKPTR